MKPHVIIIVSEDRDDSESVELRVKDRAEAEEIVREFFPPKTFTKREEDGEYPAWTWFIPNPRPFPLKPNSKLHCPL